MANKNAFRDAEELLSGPETFWILFTEDLDNIDRDEVHSQSGLYHWRLDVYCFMAEERVLVVSFGHPQQVGVVLLDRPRPDQALHDTGCGSPSSPSRNEVDAGEREVHDQGLQVRPEVIHNGREAR